SRCGLLALILAAMVLSWSQAVFAVPESDLAVAFDAQVRPFIQQHFITGSFTGTGGLTLRYREREVENAVGIVVVVGGRTEFSSKYDELLYDLRDLPLTFYSVDHRGQGISDRLLSDKNKGHVVRFEDYVIDLSIFVDTIVRKKHKGPLVIIAHSMGGLVSALYANSYPDSVQGLILCSPMLGIKTSLLPTVAARFLIQGACSLGFEDRYIFGCQSSDSGKSFSANKVTHSEARFSLNQRLVAETPDNALGNPTFGWINQAFVGMDHLAASHRQLVMPVLLLQAEEDKVVRNAPQNALCRDLPECTLVTLPGSGHEILMERDPVRNSALKRIRGFVGMIISKATVERRS
ncbi:MAG: alpha/beta fold hydrolase, partial [Desulfobulbaceae bacterium]|nr:alpha/beta fold hydrolase [Desulfobulbaceae bacterium]